MKPTQTLPETYQHAGTLDLSKDKGLAIVLNLLALVVFLLSGSVFARLALILRGENAFSITTDNALLALLLSVGVVLVGVVVHEIIHGLSFWSLTKSQPKFGLKGLYAYAAAPDWYFPRRPYFVVALAPLVVVTVAGVLLMPVVPQILLPSLLIWLVFNFAGSIGDVIIVIWLLRKPATVYIQDFGDGISVYCCEAG